MWHISSKNGILKMDRLKIITYSRIHITLVGMNTEGYRRNGGIGFSIDKPSMTCVFNPSENFEIFDNRTIPLNKKELSKLIIHLKSLRKKYKCEKAFTCLIEGTIIPHCGFGSSTMLYLSVTEALLRLNGIKYDREQLVRDSGRGGTSGIGINTYFEGGFICDIGIKNIDEQSTITPSSIAKNYQLPLVIYRHDMPQWEMGICILKRVQNLSKQQEISFFKEVKGLEQIEINKILYHTIYGVVASIEENDLEMFSQAIKNIQSTQWKLLERLNYGDEIGNAERILYQNGAKSVGMSSMGPLLFFTGDDINGIIQRVNNSNLEMECFPVKPNNSPRKLMLI